MLTATQDQFTISVVVCGKDVTVIILEPAEIAPEHNLYSQAIEILLEQHLADPAAYYPRPYLAAEQYLKNQGWRIKEKCSPHMEQYDEETIY